MNTKKLIICFAFFMSGVSLIAQDKGTSPTFEISFSTFQTNPMVFDRNYEFGPFQDDIFSDNTFGWSLGARRTQSVFLEKLNWFTGARVGLHAYSVDLFVSQDFRDLGQSDFYTSSYKSYDLLVFDVFTGLRYDLINRKRMKFGVEIAAVVNYHFKNNDVAYTSSVTLDNGQQKQLIELEARVNNDNKVIIAPQLGLSYQYNFENSGLRVGANLLAMSNTVLEGNYQLIGDNEILDGTFTKDYNFGGLEIGYFWNL